MNDSSGEWARSPCEKAELLARTFHQKSALHEGSPNEYSKLKAAIFYEDTFLPIRTKYIRRILAKLKLDSATGPDGISSRVLQFCAESRAFPLALTLRRVVHSGRWPDVWREHWLVPLFKKKARSDPRNYRGVHLTAHLSTVAERVLGRFFQPWFEQSGAYGPRQFAYTKDRGHRAALAL